MKGKVVVLLLLLAAVLVYAGGQGEAAPAGQSAEDSRYGGSLVLALPGNPVNLDMTRFTDPTVAGFMPYVVESLFEYNSEFVSVPHLV